ncbi:hypothetical protein [Polynucleobacter sp. MWH-UH2A]|uniref:hypothetical protein n=1 Tax=Polynucleobacter sp. MWH-UH2A TaxID=1855617 RepID=UPI001BFE8C44|nr:hypothetical protein [Polynucleobacter sp. MWH-UH2A]QWD64641.1 hypothetical protein IC571_03140 [Polynucleobacter sp. MWH-UH2A]
MQNKFFSHLLVASFFLTAACIGNLVNAQVNSEVPLNGSVEEGLTVAQKDKLNQNSLDQAPTGPVDCEVKYPFPASTSNNPYADNGGDICKKLQIRGKRMICEINSLVADKSSGGSTTGSKIELAAWARCNAAVANILVDGYYMAASEIERRLQICSSNFYADPGRMPKQGWYQRFLRWATSNDLTPPPSDEALEVALKQSTPLESKQETAGLMKCEWMFSRSSSPVIDVLPGGSAANGSPAPVSTPVKKTTPKKPANKQP